MSRNPMATISPQRVRRLLQRFRNRQVAVVGDVMLDRFVRGQATGISPEAPVPVVEVNHLEGTPHPGGAANVVANLRSLGALAIPFGVIGRDAAGRALREQLRQLGVPVTGLITDSGRHTTVKIRISSGHLHIVRVDWEVRKPLSRTVETQLLERFQRALGKVAAVVVSDYDKGTLTDNVLKVVLNSAQGRNVPVFVDLKRWRPRSFGGKLPATLALVNERRAAEMTQRDIRDVASARAAGRQLLAALGCQHLVMTRGSEGMLLFDPEGDTAPVKGKPWEVFDVTGAGDTVLAALTLSLMAGATLREAAELANHAAGVVVSKPGTAACSPADLLDSLSRNRTSSKS